MRCLQGAAKRRLPGLVNFVIAFPYLTTLAWLCLQQSRNLETTFSQALYMRRRAVRFLEVAIYAASQRERKRIIYRRRNGEMPS